MLAAVVFQLVDSKFRLKTLDASHDSVNLALQLSRFGANPALQFRRRRADLGPKRFLRLSNPAIAVEQQRERDNDRQSKRHHLCIGHCLHYQPSPTPQSTAHPTAYNKRLSIVSSTPLNFHLEHYEGPLDLLLDLIRKQQIDIRDIPIASITSSVFWASSRKPARWTSDISAEFVFMAATLIHIKSRMLLPVDPALRKEGETEEDPREELVERLLEHERYKNAAEMLQQKRMIEENVWSNPQMKQFAAEIEDPGLAVDMFDLVKALSAVMERLQSRPIYEIKDETVSVSDMVAHLRALLRETKKDKPLFILQVMEQQRTRRAMICLFLAVLEMVKMQAVQILQKDLFGEIALGKGERFEEAFQQPVIALEEDYK